MSADPESPHAILEFDAAELGTKPYDQLTADELGFIAGASDADLRVVAESAYRCGHVPTLAAVHMAATVILNAARIRQGATTEADYGYHEVADFANSRAQQLIWRAE